MNTIRPKMIKDQIYSFFPSLIRGRKKNVIFSLFKPPTSHFFHHKRIYFLMCVVYTHTHTHTTLSTITPQQHHLPNPAPNSPECRPENTQMLHPSPAWACWSPRAWDWGSSCCSDKSYDNFCLLCSFSIKLKTCKSLYLQNEAMTGTVHTQNPTYSRLTLALLEDSGWYLPNYEMVTKLMFQLPYWHV